MRVLPDATSWVELSMHLLGLCAAVVAFTVSYQQVAAGMPAVTPGARAAQVVTLCAAAAAIAVAMARRPVPALLPVLAISGACLSVISAAVTALSGGQEFGGPQDVAALVLLAVMVRRGPRAGVVACAVVTLTTLVVQTSAVTGWSSGGLAATLSGSSGVPLLTLLNALGWLSAVMCGLMLRQRDDARRVLQLAGTRSEERMVLARELHDLVGSRISAITVQLSALQFTNADLPSSARSAMSAAAAAGDEALEAMQRMIRVLRSDASPTVASALQAPLPPAATTVSQVIRSVVGPVRGPADASGEDGTAGSAHYESTGGEMVVEVTSRADSTALPTEVLTTVHRFLTEGLANIQRHAPTAQVVSLRADVVEGPTGLHRGVLVVRLLNDGLRTATTAHRSPRRHLGGHGLLGMRERVHALGGALTSGPDERGRWHLQMWLPLP